MSTPMMSKPSGAPATSLSFLTLGVVMLIPSGVWYTMFQPVGVGRFFSVSLFFLGLAFAIIGLSVGYIGRAARHAELPPAEVIGSVARNDQALADRAAPAVAVSTAPVGVMPTTSVQDAVPTTVRR